MDILELTHSDLSNLDTETLLKLKSECESKIIFYKSQQMTKKILINSLYGAMANKGFSLFNEKIAQSITGNGRFFIQYSANKIEEKLQSLMPSEKPFIVYGDTDSNYYQIGNIMSEIIKKNPNKTINEYVDLAIKFEEKIIDPTIQESIKEFCELFNAYNQSAVGAKREVVSDKCLSAKTTLNVQIDDKNVSIKIGELLNKFAQQGYNYRDRKPYVLDVRDKNIYIMSFNETTMKNEKKRILNIQKKLSDERMVKLINPNGRSITCTENHKIAVKVDDHIIWKCAKDIKEEDDIVYNSNKLYSKEYCLDWNKNYINPITKEDNEQKALRKNKISITKEKTKISNEIKKIEEINSLNRRIIELSKKYSGKWFKFIKLFCRNKSVYKKKHICEYISKLLYNLDKNVLFNYLTSKNFKKYMFKQKYGDASFKRYVLQNYKKNRENYFYKEKVLLNKKFRIYKHETSKQYRRAVRLYSLKQASLYNLKDFDKRSRELHIDHIVPIQFGLQYNIPYWVIGDIKNLRMIDSKTNRLKHANIDFDIVDKELFFNYIDKIKDYKDAWFHC